MTTQYAEEQGFKKKYLAPLIVLMLCAVSLTGAAYAYSTSVTDNGNIDGNYYSIDLYEKSADTVVSASLDADNNFEVQTTKTVTQNYFGSVDEQKVTFTYRVYVKSDAASGSFTLSATKATYNDKCDNTFYNGWTSETVKVAVAFSADENGTYTETLTGNINTYYFVKITVTLPEIPSADLGTAAPGDLATKLKFTGTDCITVTINATNKGA